MHADQLGGLQERWPIMLNMLQYAAGEYLQAWCCNTICANKFHDQHMTAQLQWLRTPDASILQPD